MRGEGFGGWKKKTVRNTRIERDDAMSRVEDQGIMLWCQNQWLVEDRLLKVDKLK